MELINPKYFCLVAMIYIPQISLAIQLNYGEDYDLIQAAVGSFFPRTGHLTGFTVVNVKPQFQGRDYFVRRRASDEATNSRLYVVYRKVPSSPSKYTKHIAYIRSFNGVTEVEWDPVISAKTNLADGILAQVFAPSLFSYANCEFQVKTPYRAVYDVVHNHCTTPSPYQNCCKNQKPIVPWGWLTSYLERIQEITRNGRDTKTKLNVHTETAGDEGGKAKDHFDSGYKHVKNRAVNPTEPQVTESADSQYVEFLNDEVEVFHNKPSAALPVGSSHSNPNHGMRQKRQVPGLGGLFGFGGAAASGGESPAPAPAPKKKGKKKSKKNKGEEKESEETSGEKKKSKKGKKSNDAESDEEDRRKRGSRTKRQLPMLSVLSTKISARDIAGIQSKHGHEILEKMEQLYEVNNRAQWKQAVWSKYRNIQKPVSKPVVTLPAKPEIPHMVKATTLPKTSAPPKYTSVGKFYDSILGIYSDVTIAFQSYEFVREGSASMKEALKAFVFYEDESKSGNLHIEDPTAAFTGSSTCNYEFIPIESVINPEDVGQFVDFHLSHLKAQCVRNLKQRIVKLFEIGLLKLKAGFRVAINIEHKLLLQRIPNHEDWNDCISAILFYAYTNAYMDSTEYMTIGAEGNRSPSGKPISWSVRTLSTTIFRGLELLEILPHHAVKIIKYFASVARERLMESAYLKWQLEDACKEKNCDSELNKNFNDRFQLIALMGFAVYGVDRTAQEKTRSIEASFNSFYKFNMLSVKQRAEKFGRRLNA